MSEILMGCIKQSLGEAIKEKEFRCPVCKEESMVKDWDWSGREFYGSVYDSELEKCIKDNENLNEYLFVCPMCGREIALIQEVK